MPFIGIAGGALLPLPETSDTYGTGFQVVVPIGIMSPSGKAGLSLDLGYGRIPGKEDVPAGGVDGFFPQAANAGFGRTDMPPLGVWTATVNGILRRPFGMPRVGGTVPKNGIYIKGGVGVAHVRSYIKEGREQNPTVPLWTGGAGLDFGIGQRATFFVEGRFQQLLTSRDNRAGALNATSERTNLVPIIVGFKF